MKFTLRPPDLSDADALANLHVTTWREAYAHLLPQDFFTPEYVRGRHDLWRRILQAPRPEFAIQLAEADGEPIGFAWVGPAVAADAETAPRERQLYAIYVRAAHHGENVGQSLLDATLGSQPAMLWVAKNNPRAVAFYRRNGFQFDGVEQVDPAAPAILDARMLR